MILMVARCGIEPPKRTAALEGVAALNGKSGGEGVEDTLGALFLACFGGIGAN